MLILVQSYTSKVVQKRPFCEAASVRNHLTTAAGTIHISADRSLVNLFENQDLCEYVCWARVIHHIPEYGAICASANVSMFEWLTVTVTGWFIKIRKCYPQLFRAPQLPSGPLMCVVRSSHLACAPLRQRYVVRGLCKRYQYAAPRTDVLTLALEQAR